MGKSDTIVVVSPPMQSMSIQQAAEATGWSQRMLRYLEQAGLVAALRTPGGHRHYGPRQIERLQRLRELIDGHGLGITDIAFELRMRTDPQLARAVDDWFGPHPPLGRTTPGRHLSPAHRARLAASGKTAAEGGAPTSGHGAMANPDPKEST